MKQQLQSITQTELYTELLFEHMAIGAALYDAHDFRLLGANPLYESYLNKLLAPPWRDGRILGHSLIDWLPPPYSQELVHIFSTVAQTGIPYHNEAYVVDSHFVEGSTFWDWTLHPIYDEQENIIHLLLTTTEITEQIYTRQKIEQEAHALHRETQIISERLSCLEAVEKVAHAVRESLDIAEIGQAAIDTIVSHFDTLCVTLHIAHASRKELQLLNSSAAFEDTQFLSEIQTVTYDSPLLIAQAHKYHTPIIIEDVYVLTEPFSTNMYLDKSEVRGYICIPLWFKDHFEGTLAATFKRPISTTGAEAQILSGSGMYIAAALAHARLHALVENEHTLLRTVLDQLPEGVLIVTMPEGVVSYANAATERITGIQLPPACTLAQALKKLSITDAHGRAVTPADATPALAFKGQIVHSEEYTLTRPDGRQIAVLSSTAPLYTSSNQITGAVIVFQDVTERKKLEQQKNDFLSIASHELRTPITTIQGFAEILHQHLQHGRTLNPPTTQRAINAMVQQSNHLAQLIEDMLTISRIENSSLLLHKEQHDLLSLVKDFTEMQQTLYPHYRLTFVQEETPSSAPLVGYIDREYILKVLHSLVSNAIKYSRAGTTIEIGIRSLLSPQPTALLWIKDEGVGIASSQLPYIFDRFHRACNFDQSISGLGIGLYLVRELIAAHGGSIWVESAEGQGSTFYFSLPLAINPI